MEYINHYTINTSHNRISYPGEVDKSIYFKIAKIIKKAAAGERPEVIDGTYITLTSIITDRWSEQRRRTQEGIQSHH